MTGIQSIYLTDGSTHLVASSVPDAAAHWSSALVVQYHPAEPRQLALDAHQHPPLPYRPRRRAGPLQHTRRSRLLHLQRSNPLGKSIVRDTATQHHILDDVVMASAQGPAPAVGVDLVLPQSHGQAEPHGMGAGAAKRVQPVPAMDQDADVYR